MTRKIFCNKYQQELPGVEFPPMPGEKGQYIYDHISAQAWVEWQAQQTMLINEKHLSMMNPDDRKYLMEQMDKFFHNENCDVAEGYVPPSK